MGVASALDVNGRLVSVSVSGIDFGTSRTTKVEASRQRCPGCGWESLGTIAYFMWGTPSLSLAADGRLELIGWSGAGEAAVVPVVVREICPGCGFVSSLTSPPEVVAAAGAVLGTPPAPTTVWPYSMAAATNRDGRRELFTTGALGQVWHTWEWCAGCSWSTWELLTMPIGELLAGSPAAARNADGRLEVFARTESGAIVHAWQWCGGGCGWSSWHLADHAPLGSSTDPGVATNADGRLEVFAGVDGVLHHSWQICPGCGWSPWVPVDGSPSTTRPNPYGGPPIDAANVAAATNADGRLETFFYTGLTRHVWQQCPGCGWGPAIPLGP